MSKDEKLTVLVLAAGKGKRMKSDIAKVLHEVAGRPMLSYVLDRTSELGAARAIVVVGHKKESVISMLPSGVGHAVQEPQLGTGHAVMCAENLFRDTQGDILILYGDVPLITTPTIRSLLENHRTASNSGTILTAVLDEPAGYGRIVRKAEGGVDSIVEHKDAGPEELAIKEINTGICCFKIADLLAVLTEIKDDNAQGEYYITDAVGLMRSRGMRVGAVVAANPAETEGINTEEQRAAAEIAMKNSSGGN
jgi:bifunctional UDP-N-acetylglucosamine pyrophosphorylase/glucosamine-1-phosphate N-acetyltransferase